MPISMSPRSRIEAPCRFTAPNSVTTQCTCPRVVTTRGHVHGVVTEFGAVNLHGKSLRERAELLIGVAHPNFRGELKQRLKDLRHYVV